MTSQLSPALCITNVIRKQTHFKPYLPRENYQHYIYSTKTSTQHLQSTKKTKTEGLSKRKTLISFLF